MDSATAIGTTSSGAVRVRPSSARTLFGFVAFFAVLGFVSDVLYPIASDMGAVHLPISPGELLRGLQVLLLCVLLLLRHMAVDAVDAGFAALFLLLGAVFYTLNGGSPEELAQRSFWAVKVLYLVLMMGLIRTLLARDAGYQVPLVKLLITLTVVFVVIPIYLAALGLVGYESYGWTSRAGFKGLMYAQNSTSVELIAILPVVFFYSRSVLLKTAVLGACFLLGTKAAAAAGGATMLFVVFAALRRCPRQERWHLVAPLFLGAVVGYLAFGFLASVVVTNIVGTITAFEANRDFMLVLTTGRWEYFDLLPEMVARSDVLELLLGMRAPELNEMGPTAIVTRFGLVGVLWYFLFLGRQLRWSWRNLFDDGRSAAVAFAVVMICGHSLLGGHVIANAVVVYSVATILVVNECYVAGEAR